MPGFEIGHRRVAARQTDVQPQDVGIAMLHPAMGHERLDQGLATDVDDARELRHVVDGDDEVSDARADVHERRRLCASGGTLIDEGDRRRHRTHQCEGLQIDTLDREPRLAGSLHELRDHVALGSDDEDLLLGAPVLGRARRQHLVVEDRVLERDGDGLLRLELDGGAHLFGVDHGEVHGTHDDLLIGDTERAPLAGEPALLPEALELGAKRLDVDDLALEHEARGKRPYGHSRQREPLARALDLHAGDRRLFKVDPDARPVLRHASLSACLVAL